MENVVKISDSKKLVQEPSKNYLIFNEIIRNYLPDLARAVDSGDISCDDLNITRLFEKCIAMESGLTWANELSEENLEYDFVEDQSDAKTSTVSLKAKKNKNSPVGYYEVVIGVISNTGGKQGDLRCVVYNDYTGTLDYFLVPQKRISLYQSYAGREKYGIYLTYSILNENYGQFEVFRVDTFKDICK